MSFTKLTDIINPQVMGDMIDAKVEAQAKMIPYAKVDTSLQGVAGDTKTIPAWGYIGDAEDFDPDSGNEMSTTNLSATARTFTVKCAGKSVSISQKAINSGLGNPVGQAESQLAKAIIGKVDTDLLEAALGASVVVDKSSAVIGYDAIVDAVCQFGDEEDGVDKVMFINPKQEATLLKDDDFLSADKFTSGVAVEGAIGKIAGCWIKKSKKVPAVDAVSEVKGVYTITVTGTATIGDKIDINGTTLYTAAAADAASAIVTALKTAVDADATLSALFTTSKSSGVLTLTQKVGGTGAEPVVEVSADATITAEADTTTEGVAATYACYECPIIKLEPDSAETEATEDELPALTILLKADTQVDHEWFPKKQRHDITATKYYGAVLTNDSKVIVAKFGQTNQA